MIRNDVGWMTRNYKPAKPAFWRHSLSTWASLANISLGQSQRRCPHGSIMLSGKRRETETRQFQLGLLGSLATPMMRNSADLLIYVTQWFEVWTFELVAWPQSDETLIRSFFWYPAAMEYAKATTQTLGNQYLGLSENGVYPQWNSHLVGIMIRKTLGVGVHNIFRHTHLSPDLCLCRCRVWVKLGYTKLRRWPLSLQPAGAQADISAPISSKWNASGEILTTKFRSSWWVICLDTESQHRSHVSSHVRNESDFF